jgi:hypothetical protein
MSSHSHSQSSDVSIILHGFEWQQDLGCTGQGRGCRTLAIEFSESDYGSWVLPPTVDTLQLRMKGGKCRVSDEGFQVEGVGYIYGSGFRVYGAWFRA